MKSVMYLFCVFYDKHGEYRFGQLLVHTLSYMII